MVTHILMTLISLILLQGGGGALFSILPFVMMFGVLYFLIIRPQQKRQAELRSTIEALKNGDRVVTSGGIIGVIVQTKPNAFIIRSGDKSMIEVTRAGISGRYTDAEEK